MAQFIANAPKDSELFILITFEGGRIVNAPMNSLRITWEDWTILVGVVAHSDNVIEFLSCKLINRFRPMA